LAGFFAFIWSNLCTRNIQKKITPRGHHDWPDKRAIVRSACGLGRVVAIPYNASRRIVNSFHTPLMLACLRRTDGVRREASSQAGGKMGTGRLEAFSDGVIAIIITIMVLEMKVPHGDGPNDLLPVLPVFLSYVLSFVYVGIYWNNHHHLLHATTTVTGAILWANLHLLFWLSLFPFATGWMGENHFSALPTALYGVVLLMAAIAYYLLQQAIIRSQGLDSILKKAVGRDWKGRLSPVLYMVAIVATLLSPWISEGIYVAAALIWFMPDRRIEKVLPRNDV
jgi:uncharacterized membrane protein